MRVALSADVMTDAVIAAYREVLAKHDGAQHDSLEILSFSSLPKHFLKVSCYQHGLEAYGRARRRPGP